MDEKVFHLINEQWTNPAFDFFMPLVSYAKIWTPLFLLAAVLLLIFGGFRGRAFVLCTALALGFSNALVDPLKNAVGRARPKQVQTVRMLELPHTRFAFLTIFKHARVRLSTEAERARSGNSFPSGHTNNNTVIAICTTLFYRRWGRLYWFVTLAVAYSRMYLGAHWPSDILATIFLSAGETFLVLALCEFVWEKILAPRWPQTAALHPRLFLTDERAFAQETQQPSSR